MSENKNAKTSADGGTGFIDGVWYGPTAWQCQCGKPYTVTCISSKPAKQWSGLTDDEVAQAMYRADAIITGPMQFRFAKEIEDKLKEKNHG
jgi:hypothetical protein